MNIVYRKKEISSSFIHILYLIFLTSLVFSLRAVSSISIVAIFLAEVITGRPALSFHFKKKAQNLFFAGCFLLFLLQLISLLYTNEMKQGWVNIRIKSGLLVTPLAICASLYINAGTRKKLFSHYCLVLAVATLYCLFISFLNYLHTGESSYFFYHSLVSPLAQHAIYFSLLLLIGLIFLLESIPKKENILTRSFHIFLIIYLSIFLLLLSSKLVIVFYLFYLVYWFISLLRNIQGKKHVFVFFFILSIISVSLVFAILNPISKRFYEINNGDLKMITQDRFKKSDYFNGLQFRLLQWKFVGEILTEHNRWWIGVSPGDAQSLLNENYIAKNMYTGEPARGDRGYQIYNTHNQFLQTVLQTGIVGLVPLLIICFSLLTIAFQENDRMTSFIVLLLLAWLFTESAFETQYGIMIFTFFPLLMCAGKNTKSHDGKANRLKHNCD